MKLRYSTHTLSICSFILLVLSLAYICHPSAAAAADAYSWINDKGKRVYGTKPPKNAESISGLKTRRLSRYSSTTVLQRTQQSTGNKKDAESPQQESETLSSGSSENDWGFIAAELSHDTPRIVRSTQGDVTSAKVWVENPHEFATSEVSVAFDFSNGTLIPAIGPSKIPAKSTAEYSVPDELLPIKLTGTLVSDDKVEVIVHGFKQ